MIVRSRIEHRRPVQHGIRVVLRQGDVWERRNHRGRGIGALHSELALRRQPAPCAVRGAPPREQVIEQRPGVIAACGRPRRPRGDRARCRLRPAVLLAPGIGLQCEALGNGHGAVNAPRPATDRGKRARLDNRPEAIRDRCREVLHHHGLGHRHVEGDFSRAAGIRRGDGHRVVGAQGGEGEGQEPRGGIDARPGPGDGIGQLALVIRGVGRSLIKDGEPLGDREQRRFGVLRDREVRRHEDGLRRRIGDLDRVGGGDHRSDVVRRRLAADQVEPVVCRLRGIAGGRRHHDAIHQPLDGRGVPHHVGIDARNDPRRLADGRGLDLGGAGHSRCRG